MNSCCYNYYNIPDLDSKPKVLELNSSETACNNCKCYCGYIQYESLAPYMPKLTNNYTKEEDHIILEARLRQQIVEISRLFDIETKVEEGFYSLAHYKILKLRGDGTHYLSIPEYIENTLELYTEDGYLINPNSYYYKDGQIVMNFCQNHSIHCGCHRSCGSYRSHKDRRGWFGTFQAKAKFGKECADLAVQMAVRTYLIEFNTFGDQKEAKYEGYPVTRSFRRPDVWNTVVNKYLEKKKLNSFFGFA